MRKRCNEKWRFRTTGDMWSCRAIGEGIGEYLCLTDTQGASQNEYSYNAAFGNQIDKKWKWDCRVSGMHSVGMGFGVLLLLCTKIRK